VRYINGVRGVFKRCASRNAILRYNKKAGKSGPVAPEKCKMVETLHRMSLAQNRSEPKSSWILQQPMNRDKYAYVVSWVN